MTTNPTPLTAETLAKDLVAIYNPVAGSQDLGVPYIATRIEAYAAQQNAELVAENKRLSNMDILMVAWQVRIGELQTENERLKQQSKALIPLAAWAKKHGHELTCAIRKPMPEGADRVVCTCGWVNAHNHSGLTTNQHIELAKYSDT